MSDSASLTFDEELLRGEWVQVPSNVARSPSLSTDAKALYNILLTYAGSGTVAYPSQTTLCQQLAIKSEKTLRQATKELVEAGLISFQRGGDGQNARYHVRKYAGKSPASNDNRPVKNEGLKFQTGKNYPSRPVNFTPELDTGELDTVAAATHAPVVEDLQPAAAADLENSTWNNPDSSRLDLARFKALPWFKGYLAFREQYPNDATDFDREMQSKTINKPERYFRQRIIETLNGDRPPAPPSAPSVPSAARPGRSASPETPYDPAFDSLRAGKYAVSAKHTSSPSGEANP